MPAAWLPLAKSILLLEEESAMGSSYIRVLVERGYRVVVSHSGDGAYLSWKECRPDLVLLSFRRFDQGVLDFLEAIQSAIPRQLVAFLQDQNNWLAPVFQDDKLVRVAQSPQDCLKKIDALLA
jgi:DNA-binding NtrC family response regulator